MKNAFERRREHRKLLQHARTEESRFVKILEIEARMRAYETAYMDYYNRPCKIRYCKGWYWVHNRKVRASRLQELTQRLYALKHEQNLNVPEEL